LHIPNVTGEDVRVLGGDWEAKQSVDLDTFESETAGGQARGDSNPPAF
jgi:hypothetical protein